MKDWNESKIKITSSILDAVKQIDKNGLQVVLIVEENDKLLGIVTDGDVRRAIISGVDFNSSVYDIMNRHPITANQNTERSEIKKLMTDYILHQIPVVDNNGIVVDLISFTDVLRQTQVSTPVVLMAGGLGTRLKKETIDRPKPLVDIGNKPILQTIIKEFSDQGFYNFYLSVNYKSEMIEEYFGNGEKLGVSVQYLKEKERTGTAGSLSLLPNDVEYPIVVMNGDILTKIDFKRMIDYHKKSGSKATMAVRKYDNEIPFGVIDTKDDEQMMISGIREKPSETYLVNAGMYVLGKEAVDLIPKASFFDMTQLFDTIIKNGDKTMAYPVDDYWIDIGRMEDLTRARAEYGKYF